MTTSSSSASPLLLAFGATMLPLLEARLVRILRRALEIRLVSQVVPCRLHKARRPHFKIRRQFRSEKRQPQR